MNYFSNLKTKIILTSASFELSISCNSTHLSFASFNAFDRSSMQKDYNIICK